MKIKKQSNRGFSLPAILGMVILFGFMTGAYYLKSENIISELSYQSDAINDIRSLKLMTEKGLIRGIKNNNLTVITNNDATLDNDGFFLQNTINDDFEVKYLIKLMCDNSLNCVEFKDLDGSQHSNYIIEYQITKNNTLITRELFYYFKD